DHPSPSFVLVIHDDKHAGRRGGRHPQQLRRLGGVGMSASPFKPMKPRTPGSLHHALTRAINQVGGLPTAADLIQRQENWLYKAADPDVDERRKATLSYEEARTLTRSGAEALAEDLAL